MPIALPTEPEWAELLADQYPVDRLEKFLMQMPIPDQILVGIVAVEMVLPAWDEWVAAPEVVNALESGLADSPRQAIEAAKAFVEASAGSDRTAVKSARGAANEARGIANDANWATMELEADLQGDASSAAASLASAVAWSVPGKYDDPPEEVAARAIANALVSAAGDPKRLAGFLPRWWRQVQLRHEDAS